MMFKFKCATVLQRFSIRKARFGAASVLLGTLAFLGGSVASANELESSPSDTVLVSTAESEVSVLESVSVDKGDVYGDVSNLTVEEEPVTAEVVKPAIVDSSVVVALGETREVLANVDVSSDSTFTVARSTEELLTAGSPFRSARHASTAIGDDYPQVWKNGVIWQSVDKWNMYVKECVSFAAYRLSAVNGFELPAGYGNANTWGHIARRSGYRVDMTPAVGAIAWMDSNQHGAFWAGHVAWVSRVDGDKVEIEEYNYNNTHAYHRRTIHKNQVSGYIHFKDLSRPISGGRPQDTSPSSSPKLAPRGTYRFDKRLGIKSEPKMTSPDLAYYDVGNTVNYDRVLEADGHQWISYLSYSGNRRYIAVNQLASEVTSPVRVSLPPSGTYHFTQRASIKAEPKQSSPELAYYDKGYSVNYDSIVTSEGRQWLSYLSYAGNRRYVELP